MIADISVRPNKQVGACVASVLHIVSRVTVDSKEYFEVEIVGDMLGLIESHDVSIFQQGSYC